jgi:hypothetical protein
VRRAVAVALSVLIVGSGLALATPAAAREATGAGDQSGPGGTTSVTAPSRGTVLINEVANGGSRSDSDTFFELRNWGSTAVDLSDWEIFRCNVFGLRANIGQPEADFDGVILQPGGLYTVSKIGMPGDDHYSQPFAQGGFGLYLEDPSGALADRVGVYPNEPWPMQSECTQGQNLTNTLAFAFDESWQRVAATGDVSRDFVVASATLGEQNVRAGVAPEVSGIRVSEFAPGGARGRGDEFVEIANTSVVARDIGGLEVYRCTRDGSLQSAGAEYEFASGTILEPGDHVVLGGPSFVGTTLDHYPVAFNDEASGVYLRSAAGVVVDRLAISAYGDSACQGPTSKLPAVLDYVTNESYQLVGNDYIVAPRTPGTANEIGGSSLATQVVDYTELGVAISEFATDPSSEGLPAGYVQHNYVELGNYGSTTVDISGWTTRSCDVTGYRSRDVQSTVPPGTALRPGQTYLVALTGTPDAATARATTETGFDFAGTGVWIADANGERVDSVGVYAVNEMDASIVTLSPCTKGRALTTFQPDRVLGETFQRTRFTGVDADDFVTAPATPGRIDNLPWVDPTTRVAGVVESVERDAPPAVRSMPAAAQSVSVLEAWAGATEGEELADYSVPSEVALDATAPAEVTDSAWAYPYQRFVLDASDYSVGDTISWLGSAAERTEIHLSVWTGSEWRRADTGAGLLEATLEEGEIAGGQISILVQNAPRAQPTMSTDLDGELEKPSTYDLAISHITDSQYLTEAYPEVYAQLVSWIADNADARKIGFVTHTGDLIQNWVDPNQERERARAEYQRASAVQSILDDAGIPNSVLPGNHDNKRGVDNSLFNEYFPPSRYADAPSYAGSIAPNDNSSNFSTFEQAGAKFLMLSLPYAYGEHEIAWAKTVVTSHPEFNVIISTHEHVTPKSTFENAHLSSNSRWVSRASDLWDEVIAPNRNVILVLSGHFHGIGQLVTKDAGGIPGHDVVELLADYQEFRTHTGERATGFQRLLQFDYASSTVAVDTFSVRLGESASYPYDYQQFKRDTGRTTVLSNLRPWNLVAAGTQDRYTQQDDEFQATVHLQYKKSVATTAIGWQSHSVDDVGAMPFRSPGALVAAV